MLSYGSCPRCQNDIGNDRLNESVVICPHCGWSDNKSYKKAQGKVDRRFIVYSMTISLLLSLAFIHLVTWDKHSVAVIPLQAKIYALGATATDYRDYAEICWDRGHPECVETSYRRIIETNPNDLEAWAKLGQILRLGKKDIPALNAYKQYFERGGVNPAIGYEYAQVLSRNNQLDEAIRYFQFALNSKPEMLQVTISQEFVRMLKNSGRLEEAKKVIEDIRTRGKNTAHFMETELKQIKGGS